MKRSVLSLLFGLMAFFASAQVQYGGLLKAPNNDGTVANVARNNDALKVWDSTAAVKLDSAKLSRYLIAVANFPATQAVSGTVGISGTVPVSGTFWQTTQPISFGGGSTLGQAAAASSIPVALANEQVQDKYITGQSGQSALGNNILLASAGTSAIDVMSGNGVSYRSFSVQINGSSGISAGQVQFEESNDGVTFYPMGFINEGQSLSSTGFGVATILASTNYFFSGRLRFRYFQCRISTGFVGGTVSAFTRLSTSDAVPRVTGVELGSGGVKASVKAGSTAAVAGDAALVVAVSPNNTIPTQAADNSASISIAANATSSGSITTATGAGTVEVLLTGTFTATVQVQVSTDAGTTWSNVTGGSQIMNKLTGAYMASGNLTATGTYVMSVAGSVGVRVITTAYTSGTVTGTVRATQAQAMVGIIGTPTMNSIQSGTWTVQPGNTANTTAWLTTLQAKTTNGTTTSTVNSAATTNATNLKASAGAVYSISVMNTTASTKYVRLYNKASAPTVGTDVPIMVIAIPATSSKEIEFPAGITFGTGIGYSITGGAGATDATAVAAGDVQLLISWI